MWNAKKLAVYSLLTALALALSYAERFIPLGLLLPVPGLKLGLANIVSIYALFTLGFFPALAILSVRCLLASLFGSGLSAFLFSIAGGVLSLGLMWLTKRGYDRRFSMYGVSMAGAAGHNLGQILAAAVWMQSAAVFSYLPWLLLSSLLTGAVTAAAADLLLRRTRWIRV